jgi:hypothetical protein
LEATRDRPARSCTLSIVECTGTVSAKSLVWRQRDCAKDNRDGQGGTKVVCHLVIRHGDVTCVTSMWSPAGRPAALLQPALRPLLRTHILPNPHNAQMALSQTTNRIRRVAQSIGRQMRLPLMAASSFCSGRSERRRQAEPAPGFPLRVRNATVRRFEHAGKHTTRCAMQHAVRANFTNRGNPTLTTVRDKETLRAGHQNRPDRL